ncbi:hypothetical protein BH09PLA1_BH09PLA1_34010 [soil metagenome]
MQMNFSNLSRAFVGACAVVALGFAQASFASSGSILPLDQYQAGTESVDTTNVKNGGFEAVTSGVPNFWTAGSPLGTGTLAVGSSMQVAAPIGANTSPAVNGTKAAQGPVGSQVKRNGYTQLITFDQLPNQAADSNYQLSGYAWNFSNSAYDLIVVELRDRDNRELSKTWSLSASDPFLVYSDPPIDGSRGVFGSKSFSSTFFPSGVAELQVSFEYDFDNDPGTVRPSIAAQMDNISITPSSQFVAPRAVPEPASLSVLALAGLGAMRRRRSALELRINSIDNHAARRTFGEPHDCRWN